MRCIKYLSKRKIFFYCKNIFPHNHKNILVVPQPVLHIRVGGDEPEPVHPVEAEGEHVLGRGEAEALLLYLEEQTVRGASEVDARDVLEVLALKQFHQVQ